MTTYDIQGDDVVSSTSSGALADVSSFGSAESSFNDGRSVDTSHYEAASLEDASLGPHHAPLIVPFEAQARINRFLQENGMIITRLALRTTLTFQPGYTPVLTGNLVLDENGELHVESLYNEVDISQEAIDHYTRHDVPRTPSLADSDDVESVFGPDDDAMSIVSTRDIPVDVTRVFYETATPGVFMIDYHTSHEPGKPLVQGGPDDDNDDFPEGAAIEDSVPELLDISDDSGEYPSLEGDGPEPLDASDDMDDVPSVEETPYELYFGPNDSELRDDKTDPGLPPQTTVAESVNESSYSTCFADQVRASIDQTQGIIMYALKWLASNPLHVANRYDNMPHDLLEDLCIVLSRFLPNDFAQPRYEPVTAILKMGMHIYGIDWLVRHNSGRVQWIRDIDLWQSPNGRLMVALWWASRRRSLSLADINHLLSLPQYELEDGYPLRLMREKLLRGEMLPPRYITART
ncbi:hypothetical protein AURDEDRAFT_131513 [Auricularia subglabra TFB-10046 SS5]|uniref:Uncharacterized protein n=1 Tax=Auricularia subglabra (strain TFB-10046 / SS5) TaxID=717982 RepID=J0WN27_AURST|nr:hypothetical protein AURDEDRAFT_131513 [Auricularia subglabra TFB-10046 SS5]